MGVWLDFLRGCGKEKPMGEDRHERTRMLLGADAPERLAKARVAVFGLGGVGGYIVEALARCGVGALDLIDDDCVCMSNINRQIIATHETVGRRKTQTAAERVAAIAPECTVRTYDMKYLPETAGQFDFTQYDYVADAIDIVAGKISLVLQAQAAGTPIISAMGTGNKLDPTQLVAADIYETSVCPLARVMRRELRRRGVKSLRVVYSREEPRTPQCEAAEEETRKRRATPASAVFVPASAGLLMASEIVYHILETK